jgi:Domain of unknown function (DUF3291)
MWHLAEINIARLIAPIDDPRIASFVAQIDAINALAEHAPGFVWRLTASGGAASTYVRYSDDDRIIVNMSAWIGIEALHAYVYRSGHGAVFRDRRQWFEPLGNSMALWWIPEGHTPTLDEGRSKLELVTQRGPSPEAFTFKQRFPPPAPR